MLAFNKTISIATAMMYELNIVVLHSAIRSKRESQGRESDRRFLSQTPQSEDSGDPTPSSLMSQ